MGRKLSSSVAFSGGGDAAFAVVQQCHWSWNALKIRTRLLASFLLVSLLPLMVVRAIALHALYSIRTVTARESIAAVQLLGDPTMQSQWQAVERKVNGTYDEAQHLVLAALVVVGTCAGGFGAWLAANLSRPISRLTRAAELHQRGRYQPDRIQAERARPDDLGQLARTFDRMARGVRDREERLQHQVQALRIEIDQSKKDRQVAEIIESEYFVRLRDKAQDLKRASAIDDENARAT